MAHCKQTAWFLLLGAAVLLAGCEPAEREPLELAPGQEPYLRFCASCHGNDGRGTPPRFPPLSVAGWTELPPEGVALIVLYGLRGDIEVDGRSYRGFMPPMRNVSDEDIAAIVGYLEREWAGRESDLTAADVGQMREALAGHSVPEGRQGVREALEKLE